MGVFFVNYRHGGLDEKFQVPIHSLVMVYKVPTLNNFISYHALASENIIYISRVLPG